MDGQELLDENMIEFMGEKAFDDYLEELAVLIQRLYSGENTTEEYLNAVKSYRNEHHIYRAGDKIALMKMNDTYTTLSVGAIGYITGFGKTPTGELQIWINWENGSTLNVLHPIDSIQILEVSTT